MLGKDVVGNSSDFDSIHMDIKRNMLELRKMPIDYRGNVNSVTRLVKKYNNSVFEISRTIEFDIIKRPEKIFKEVQDLKGILLDIESKLRTEDQKSHSVVMFNITKNIQIINEVFISIKKSLPIMSEMPVRLSACSQTMFPAQDRANASAVEKYNERSFRFSLSINTFCDKFTRRILKANKGFSTYYEEKFGSKEKYRDELVEMQEKSKELSLNDDDRDLLEFAIANVNEDLQEDKMREKGKEKEESLSNPSGFNAH